MRASVSGAAASVVPAGPPPQAASARGRSSSANRTASHDTRATATSPARPAFATTRRLFASTVSPPLRSWRNARTNGVTAWPRTPCRSRLREALLDQRLDVEALVGRAGEEEAAAAELPVRERDLRRLRRGLDPGRDRRAAAARGRRAAARPCGSRARGRRTSRAAPRSRGRRGSTSRPRRRRAPACSRARRCRPRCRSSAPSRGGRRRSRRSPWSRSRPRGRRQRAADRGRAERALRRAGGEVARPGLARVAASAKRASASSSSPTRISPSSTPIVAGTAPAARTAASHAQRDLEPLAAPGSRARRASSRARRPARARRERPPPRARSTHAGNAPMRATQRAAASSASSDAVYEETGGERVARAGRVDDVGGDGRVRLAVDEAAVGAALFDHRRRVGAPTSATSSSFPKTMSGASAATRSRNASRRAPGSRHRGEVEADRAPPSRASSAARSAVAAIGGRTSVYAGEMERRRSRQPRRDQLLRREVGGDAAVAEHRPRSVRRGERDDGAGTGLDLRAAISTPRRASSSREHSPGRVAPRACRRSAPRRPAPRPRRRRLRPARPARRACGRRCPCPPAIGPSSRTTTSRSRSPSVQITRATLD